MAIDPETGAMTSRIEKIYECPQYRLFFKTGQPSGTMRFDGIGERKANIVAIPYHTLSVEQTAELRSNAEDIAQSRVDILINKRGQTIQFYDRLTQTTSSIGFDKLDRELQMNLFNLMNNPLAPKV